MALQHTGGEHLGIGDVSKICGVPVHTLRYWEREFCDYLQPSRTRGKQRRYSDEDIRKLLRVKTLLWTQRFTIRAAKRILSVGGMGAEPFLERRGMVDNRRLMMRLAQFAGGTMVMTEQVA